MKKLALLSLLVLPAMFQSVDAKIGGAIRQQWAIARQKAEKGLKNFIEEAKRWEISKPYDDSLERQLLAEAQQLQNKAASQEQRQVQERTGALGNFWRWHRAAFHTRMIADINVLMSRPEVIKYWDGEFGAQYDFVDSLAKLTQAAQLRALKVRAEELSKRFVQKFRVRELYEPRIRLLVYRFLRKLRMTHAAARSSAIELARQEHLKRIFADERVQAWLATQISAEMMIMQGYGLLSRPEHEQKIMAHSAAERITDIFLGEFSALVVRTSDRALLLDAFEQRFNDEIEKLETAEADALVAAIDTVQREEAAQRKGPPPVPPRPPRPSKEKVAKRPPSPAELVESKERLKRRRTEQEIVVPSRAAAWEKMDEDDLRRELQRLNLQQIKAKFSQHLGGKEKTQEQKQLDADIEFVHKQLKVKEDAPLPVEKEWL